MKGYIECLMIIICLKVYIPTETILKPFTLKLLSPYDFSALVLNAISRNTKLTIWGHPTFEDVPKSTSSQAAAYIAHQIVKLNRV